MMPRAQGVPIYRENESKQYYIDEIIGGAPRNLRRIWLKNWLPEKGS